MSGRDKKSATPCIVRCSIESGKETGEIRP
jgi:hypothetical protein